MDQMDATDSGTRAVTNIIGLALIVILISLTSVIIYQQTQLEAAVKTLAIVYSKCKATDGARPLPPDAGTLPPSRP